MNLLIGTGHFLSHFYMLCLPPLFVAWQQSFHVGYAALGLAVALLSAVTAILQTPVGLLVDRYGARYFLIGGAAVMTLAIAAMGVAAEYWQILVLAILSGIGNSVIHPCNYAILSASVSSDRVGRAFSFHTFAGNLGFAAGPPVTIGLTLLLGWRGALAVVGMAGLPLVASML
ncbi:MAG: MFS transporter [Acetobacteraceae bacterium]